MMDEEMYMKTHVAFKEGLVRMTGDRKQKLIYIVGAKFNCVNYEGEEFSIPEIILSPIEAIRSGFAMLKFGLIGYFNNKVFKLLPKK